MAQTADDGFGRRALLASAALAGVFALFAAVWYTADVLAPMLLGALFGIFLYELAGWVSRVAPVRGRWAVGLTLLLLLLVFGATCYALGMRIADQFTQLMDMLPKGLDAAREWVSQHPRLHALAGSLTQSGQAPGGSVTGVVRGARSAVKGAMDLGVALFAAFFTGVFLAMSPEFYSDAVVALVPAGHRPRWRRMLADLWRWLWLWFVGRLFVMLAIGVAHIAAYWLLGVPLPVALGVIAGGLAFIPFLGPIAATIPAALVALTKSPHLMLWVILVHGLVQMAESHILTPLTQEYMVDVPALGTIAAFLVFGKMMGVMGVIVATPLSAVIIVLVRHLYVEGALGEKTGDAAGRVR